MKYRFKNVCVVFIIVSGFSVFSQFVLSSRESNERVLKNNVGVEKILCRVELKTKTRVFGLNWSHGSGDYFVNDGAHCERISRAVLWGLNRKPRLWSFLISEHVVEMGLKKIKFKKAEPPKFNGLRAIARNEKKPFLNRVSLSAEFKDGSRGTKLADLQIRKTDLGGEGSSVLAR